jgi:hypothetical protein
MGWDFTGLSNVNHTAPGLHHRALHGSDKAERVYQGVYPGPAGLSNPEVISPLGSPHVAAVAIAVLSAGVTPHVWLRDWVKFAVHTHSTYTSYTP